MDECHTDSQVHALPPRVIEHGGVKHTRQRERNRTVPVIRPVHHEIILKITRHGLRTGRKQDNVIGKPGRLCNDLKNVVYRIGVLSAYLQINVLLGTVFFWIIRQQLILRTEANHGTNSNLGDF